jgi:hypothetical protein
LTLFITSVFASADIFAASFREASSHYQPSFLRQAILLMPRFVFFRRLIRIFRDDDIDFQLAELPHDSHAACHYAEIFAIDGQPFSHCFSPAAAAAPAFAAAVLRRTFSINISIFQTAD